jgi:predicted RecB family nuclease
MLINADLLLQYQRCKRRPFLDIHGDFAQRDRPTDLLVKLQQDKILHHKTVIGKRDYQQPRYPRKDWQTGHNETVKLMQQGVELIYHGLLLAPHHEVITEEIWQEDCVFSDQAGQLTGTIPVSSLELKQHTLVSRPDLLVKKAGKSIFGDWIYVPVTIELGKRPKQEYQVTAAFHALVLQTTQQQETENAWVVLRGRNTTHRVDLGKWKPQMQQILVECIDTLQSATPPEMFISRQKCNLCHWHSQCHAIAQSQQHLSLLPGVTPVRYTQLQILDITTPVALANADPVELENLPGFDSIIAHKVVLQAQSIITNKPVLLPQAQPNQPWIQNSADIELYFDIEAQPDLDLNYLLGVLVVDKQNNSQKFHSFLAEKPEDEKIVWQQFVNLVSQYPDAPIYHFCVYEFDTVKRLAKIYGTSNATIKPILFRFIDIYEEFIQSVALPVESYALKTIARWLGFQWRNPEASGAKCIYWYDQWLQTSDRTLLETIETYNEDDCHATRAVKDWLVEFLSSHSQTP